jgi:hypothetical protein
MASASLGFTHLQPPLQTIETRDPDAPVARNLHIPDSVLAAFLRTASRVGFDAHPRDQALRSRFFEQRHHFEEVRAMLLDDAHIAFLGTDQIYVRDEEGTRRSEDGAIPSSRLARYRYLMDTIGLMAMSEANGTITCRVSTFGTTAKGFVFHPDGPVMMDQLDSHPRNDADHAHVWLDGEWHLYYGWDW